jgi:hypothetical protein
MRITSQTRALRSAIAMGLLMEVFPPLSAQNNSDQSSRVTKNTFVSPLNPTMTVHVEGQLKYLGSVPFTIDNLATGYRYAFVRADHNKHIEQMFIIQQEGFLPSSNDTYKYPITNPAKLGNFDYRPSVTFDDSAADIRENPGKESDLTRQFLASRGYTLEPELVMSRFARPTDPAHKHEIIFFCFENLSAFGHKLADFFEESDNPAKQEIKQKVDDNCRHTFRVSGEGPPS